MMIDKAKKDRLTFSLVAIASAVIAIVTTAVVIMLVLKQNYVPMWFILGVSAICFYTSVFCTFSAFDRNTAVMMLGEIEALGTDNVQTIAEKLGWKEKALEKFVKKLVKWGYISK